MMWLIQFLAIEIKNNYGKIYEIGGPKIISFGEMVRSILKSINKKRLVFDMPISIAKFKVQFSAYCLFHQF